MENTVYINHKLKAILQFELMFICGFADWDVSPAACPEAEMFSVGETATEPFKHLIDTIFTPQHPSQHSTT